MSLPGYEIIQEIARNDWQALHRARRHEDQHPVLLKTPQHTPPSQAEMDLLAREFEVLRELSIAGVPRVYDLLREDGDCCLVLEDRGGAPLHSLPGSRRMNLDSFFKLAIQLATILAELHRQEIIHQSINPGAILLNPTTGEACLTDFSLASRSVGETPTAQPPLLLRRTLAYLSPEQTGRMNRAVDYRTDFYSLGVTFYELLTGSPPFRSDDLLELIHWHIAKTPPAPAAVNPEIPEPLSEIVMKLLAKTAEQRYQSALGLKADLEICAREWAAERRITPFPLGQRDISDRFNIPQSLYGREPDVEHLLAAFDQVCEGTAALMLVAGYSGIGKTSLIQELYKPIVRERGYFIAGKFDQIVRNIPYGALIQAFRALCHQLLTGSEEQLAAWRERLTGALGANSGVVAEVIPEIELILGKQPPPPSLGPTEAQNRFRLVFENFVRAIARREHPLVIFLDDLQWVDSATLSLLHALLTSPDIQFLFLIGAYRDNEVDAAHPLIRALGALEAAGLKLRRINLGPLRLADLTHFIRDAFRSDLAEVEPLARLVLQKTDGNPFFVIQFLKTLKQEGLLTFDYGQGRWTFRLEAIANAAMTDNVIDLMTRKIQRLPSETQRALTLAACIGNQFDLDTLATVSQQPSQAAMANLKEAIDEGLVVPKSSITHAFLHDRVQQAAYALIPDEWKHPVHLTVGRLLLGQDETAVEEKLFDIVHHLNIGSSLIFDEAERLNLARLNLNAGRKAKASTAYQAALQLLEAGLALLNQSHWESDYDLAFALHLEAAECQYHCGNFDEAEQQFALLLEHARTSLDKARVYNLRMVQYENMSRYADALATARESLALFGVSFPDSASEKQAALETELESIQSLLALFGGGGIESLIDLSEMTDPEMRMVMSILTDIWASTYILGDAALSRLISATMVRLSLAHGNLAESAYGYVTHAITVGPVLKDYKSAYEFGRLALLVNERFNDAKRRAKIHQQFHAHVALWRQPMEVCIHHAREACRSGLEVGDFLYAAYGAATETWPAMVSTNDLAQFLRDYTPSLALIRKLKVTSFADAHNLFLHWALALQGETGAPLSLSDEEFDENQYQETYRDNPFFTMLHAAVKLQLCYLFEEYAEALTVAQVMDEIVRRLEGMIWTVVFDFWNGLTLAANYDSATEREQRAYLAEMERARAAMSLRSASCPENYRCQTLLLGAEIERVTGEEISAIELYERAIRYADQTGALQHQALASELYARFWLSRGATRIAAVFMTEARACYAQWGAKAKVAALEGKYPDLLAEHRPLTIGKPAASQEPVSLDIATVTKAAHAIASEIVLEDLLRKLMRIAIENAGAQRGIFIWEKDGQLLIAAEGSVDRDKARVLEAAPLEPSQPLSWAVVHYVHKMRESVVIGNALADERFASDPYVAGAKPRSILCVPVVHQGKFEGILYLENNLIANAFTAERIEVMSILSSQAAISLESARLYDEMRQEATRRRQMEETLRSIVEGTAAVTGSDFFSSLVRHLASALNVRYAFVTECLDQTKTRARTLAFWMNDRLGDNVEYEVAATPCLKVLEGQICYYSGNVQKLFPNDTDLVEMRAESYLGIPISDYSGQIIGHLAVLDDQPMADTSRSMPILKIFAARAGAELERLKAEEDLRAALAEVERLKNRLHAENVYLQEEIRREHNFEEIIGSNPALLEVLRQIERVAPTDSTVLILGETGTGKELIARAIHNLSARRDRPLVKVNCGAITAGLVESELFGHTKGAFTGAIDKRVGRFELADGGTLFLDEVGELPPETQVKLLRVLQEGEFEPVGSSKTVKVDVRIIAATNRNLEDAVREGRFRSDLFYRLNVLPLRLPSLRERRSDVPQLVMFFLSRFAKQFGKKLEGVSQETMEMLVNYDWPGNIREMQNIIERGVVLSSGPVLTLDRVLPQSSDADRAVTLKEAAAAASLSPLSSSSRADREETLPPVSRTSASAPSTLENVERQHILSVLEQTGWVIEGERGAAKILNLHPNTLRSRMKKLGIRRPGQE